MKIIQPPSGGLDKFNIIIYTFLCMMTKYQWFLKIIRLPLDLKWAEFLWLSLPIFNWRYYSYYWLQYITNYNGFDIKFIFYLLSKLKKLIYKLLILHKTKY